MDEGEASIEGAERGAVHETLETEEELGYRPGKEDAASDRWCELVIVGAPFEYLFLKIKGVLVTPRPDVKV